MNEIINKVLEGDCLDYLQQLEPESVDLVVTDPPFNMDYSGRRNRKRHFDKFANDNMDPGEHTTWFKMVLEAIHRVMKKDSSMYVFVDFRNYPRFYPAIDSLFDLKHCIVWDKEVIGMGYYYRFQHEFIIYAHKGKGKPLNFEKKNVPDIIKAKRVRPLEHPTQKPLSLIEELITNSSNEGDLVADPFAGSFTTAVACKNLNRNFFCTEMDPVYCELGAKRLQ